MSEDKACDFCSGRPVVARHQIDSRAVAPWEDQPAKWWYACAECHPLIMAGDSWALVQRAARQLDSLIGRPLSHREAIAQASHDGFWSMEAGIYEMLES